MVNVGKSEREHEFTLVLGGISKLTSADEDALFDAGCDDATLVVRSGRVFISFSRQSASMKDAIISAIKDVKKAIVGTEVVRIDECNLVSQSDIARKIGRSRQLVHQYMTGVRGPGEFPAPACEVTDGAPLWYWCEVANWLWKNDMIKEVDLRDAEEIDAINTVLDMERSRKANPPLIEEVYRSITQCLEPGKTG